MLEWRGLEQQTRERCSVERTKDGFRIHSALTAEKDAFGIELTTSTRDLYYELDLDANWQARRMLVRGNWDRQVFLWNLVRRAEGWVDRNGAIIADGAIWAIDISATPLTNTQAICGLNLAGTDSDALSVLYFDLDEAAVKTTRQRYTRLEQNSYRFESIPAGFDAVITTDDAGFVTDYPGLFSRC